MNKVYKVVWNASLGVWVAVSEIAKGKTKNSGSVGQTLSLEHKEPQSLGNLFFNYKALTLAIFAAFTADFAHAGYEAGGGTTRTNCTRTSNGTGGEAAAIAIANENSTACASAVEAIAIGANLAAQGAQSTVIGNDVVTSTSAEQAVVIGSNFNVNPTTSNGKGGVAIGSGLSTTHSSPIADGQGSLALGSSGDGTTINGTTYNQQGPDAKAAYSAALMAGSQVATGADKSIAFGVDAKVSANIKDAIALGTGAVASVNNSVALGGGSTTTAPTGTGYITNTTAPTSVVSVGSSTNLRRIQNVADGAADQDAVTVAQLKDVNNRAVGNTTALGGGAAYDPSTNVYTAPTFTTTKTDGITVNSNTVSGALTNLNNEVIKPITFSGNTGSSANKLGSTLNITGTGSTAGTYSGNNLKTSVSGNTVSIQMADAPVFTGTVTAGNLATGGTLSVTGVSNLNGGANLNNQKITNVAAGTASGDAVNFGQLTTTNNNVTTAQNAANAAQTSANAAQTTANSALTEAQKGLNFRANAGATDKVSLGETVTLADGTNTTVTYDATTNTYKYSVVDAPTFTGTVTAGNLATGGTLSVTGVSNLNGGANLNNQKITNVADGSVAAGSKDAVNGGQLFTTNQNVSTNATNIATNTSNIATNTSNIATNTSNIATNTTDISNLQGQTFKLQANGDTASAVASSDTVQFIDGDNIDITRSGNDITIATSKDLTVDSVTAGNSKLDTTGLVITGGPSITTTGIDAGSKVISNVADGSVAAGSKDAVNGGQLFTTNQNVSTNATNIATNTSNIATNTSNIATNTSNIATNTSNIATNTSNIATNTTDISNLQGQTFKLQANGDTASAVASSDTVQFIDGDNIDITRSGNDITIATSKDLTVDSVTAGNSKLDTTGLVITGGPSITTTGIDAGSKVISNVADGSVAAGSKDAVNGGQLFTTNQNLSTNATNIATNTSNIATNTSNIATNTTDISNLQGQTFKLQANGDTASAVASSDTVQFIDGDNIDITRSGNDITIATSKDLTVDSVTTGNSKLDNSGLVIT
ncbi:ESPR-type extended signal peptide-containing protein, partial [Acinetobacter venetianus]|uniref:ESPR-type extended signal peptide-containing protein n=1 Tax=Acinetobacter venetianus TaxID=52133 RepID=UPI0021504112